VAKINVAHRVAEKSGDQLICSTGS